MRKKTAVLIGVLAIFVLAGLLRAGSAGARETLPGGITNIKLSGSMPPDGDIELFQINPDSERVIFTADLEADEKFELYSVPIDGSGPPVKINDPLSSSGDVRAFTIAPNGGRVLYGVWFGTSEFDDRYLSVPVDGSLPATELELPGLGRYIFAISPDSAWAVVFILEKDSTDNAVHRIPVDGSAAGEPIFIMEAAEHFAFCSDGGMTIFEGYLSDIGPRQLYSLVFDGTSSPIMLNDPLPDGDGVGEYRMTSDCSYAVFDVNVQVEPGIWASELYGVLIDGSAPAVKLNPPLPSDTSVLGWGIAPNNSQVVFESDHEDEGTLEIYRIPIDGSSSPLKLNPPLVTGGDAGSIEFPPDGQYVVYVADQEVNGEREGYRASLTGAPDVLKLTDYDSHGNVMWFMGFASDSSRTIFVTQPTTGMYELYSVPLDGSAAPVRLNDPLPTGGSVSDFPILITPDNQWVVFRADQSGDDINELYLAPIDGSESPVKLHPDLGQNEDVEPFTYAMSPDGEWVVYTADQDEDGIFELYASSLPGGSPTETPTSTSGTPSPTPTPTSTSATPSPTPTLTSTSAIPTPTPTSTATPTATLPSEDLIYLPIVIR